MSGHICTPRAALPGSRSCRSAALLSSTPLGTPPQTLSLLKQNCLGRTRHLGRKVTPCLTWLSRFTQKTSLLLTASKSYSTAPLAEPIPKLHIKIQARSLHGHLPRRLQDIRVEQKQGDRNALQAFVTARSRRSGSSPPKEPESAPVPNEMHPQVLRELVDEAAQPLPIILEKLWQTGELPADWKR